MSRKIYFHAALAVALAMSAALILALIAEQAFGLAPCELCLAERWPYYIGVPLGFLLALAYMRDQSQAALKTGMVALLVVLGWSLYLGIYHAGVEWGWWQGPTACSDMNVELNVPGLLAQLKIAKVVPCDVPQWRLFGLFSFADLNALLSAGLLIIVAAALAGKDLIEKLRRYASSSVSQ